MTAPQSSSDPNRPETDSARPRASDGQVRSQLLLDVGTLERRVLAHEHILQSLIAHMAETEPRFLDRLADRFSDPIGVARSEHPHTSSDGHAGAFVKAIELLVAQTHLPSVLQPKARAPNAVSDDSDAHSSTPPHQVEIEASRVVVRNRSGVWEVKVDGQFFGDFTRQKQADQVAVVLRQMIGADAAEQRAKCDQLGGA